MSHYEQRLANDKAAIRSRIVTMGRLCTEAVIRATAAMLDGDRPKAYQVVLDDLPINRESRSIDKACHAFVCLLYTSPSPRDQRGSRMPSSA